jgi:hypothetical protein
MKILIEEQGQKMRRFDSIKFLAKFGLIQILF